VKKQLLYKTSPKNADVTT